MIRETHIDECINRLLTCFGPRAIGRPPATAASLAALEARVGPLPRDLTLFLSTTDGMRIELAEPWPFGHLWSTHEMLNADDRQGQPGIPHGLLPVCGSEKTPRDCIVMLAGPCHGAMMRCDPWAGESSLIASSFGTYLQNWTKYTIQHFDSQGRPKPVRAAGRFDREYLARLDHDLDHLREDADVNSLIGELHMTFAGGADFE